MRLDKCLADCGVATRSELKEMIRKGRVRVDNVVARDPGIQVRPGENDISVDGAPLSWQKRLVYLMNKPAGVITATEDSKMETVLDLLPENVRRMGLFPVGRLDRDTEGLLLLTNDGHLAHGLLAPKKHVDKQYEAILDREPEPDAEKRFLEGIALADGTICRPAVLERRPSVRRVWPDSAFEREKDAGESSKEMSTYEERADKEKEEKEIQHQESPYGERTSGEIRDCPVAHVTIVEGKFHQVKRMFLAAGSRVLYLKRLRMGPILLGEDLAPGEFRPLAPGEIEGLVRQAGLEP